MRVYHSRELHSLLNEQDTLCSLHQEEPIVLQVIPFFGVINHHVHPIQLNVTHSAAAVFFVVFVFFTFCK